LEQFNRSFTREATEIGESMDELERDSVNEFRKWILEWLADMKKAIDDIRHGRKT